MRPVRGAQHQGEKVARSSAFEWLARAGFVARGAIYLIIGVLAVKLAFGEGGETTDQQGALREIAQQSFGEILLIAVAIGLGGYALWRLVRAAIGHGPESSDSTWDRVADVASGVCYAALCFTAISILRGASSGSSNEDQTTGGVLGWSGGPIIVAVAGVVLIGVGLYQGYKGVSTSFLEDSKTEQMSPQVEGAFTALGVIGHVSRMVVFGLIGYFLIRAAIDYDADEAVGLDGALAKVAQQDYGTVLLAIVAIGLIAFGAYSLADARYRRV